MGYGSTKGFDGKTARAHRFVWEITYGPIPDGMCVLHKCDNPPYCNPDHLYLGTHQDNMLDRSRRGRTSSGPGMGSPGSKNGHAKLTEADVLIIRSLLTTDILQKDIAIRFSVAKSHITNIKQQKRWKHIK